MHENPTSFAADYEVGLKLLQLDIVPFDEPLAERGPAIELDDRAVTST